MSTDTAPHLPLIKLHTADHLTYLRANHLLKQHGITIQQALIIQYLAWHAGHSINQKNIELYLGISNPSVTSLMKTMVAKNLIRRLPDRSDARSYLLCLTPHGQQLQESICKAFEQLSRRAAAAEQPLIGRENAKRTLDVVLQLQAVRMQKLLERFPLGQKGKLQRADLIVLHKYLPARISKKRPVSALPAGRRLCASFN